MVIRQIKHQEGSEPDPYDVWSDSGGSEKETKKEKNGTKS